MFKHECQNCIFAAHMMPDDVVLCRKNAPIVVGGLHNEEKTVWPVVDRVDYCGDFARDYPEDGRYD